MKYVSLVLQSVLRFAIVCFLSFVWIRYFVHSLWLSLLLSAIVATTFELFLRIFVNRRDKKLNLKIKEKEQAENFCLSLALDKNCLDFFFKIASKEDPLCKKKKDCIVLKNNVLLFPIITLQPLACNDLAKAIKVALRENCNKIVVPCSEVSKEAAIFVKSLDKNIVLLDKFDCLVSLYNFYDIYPNVNLTYQKTKKLAIKQLVAYAFNRNRTKGYVFAAFILFLSTLFIRLNVYYCIAASVLVLFAFVSYFNPYFNNKKAAKPLE